MSIIKRNRNIYVRDVELSSIWAIDLNSKKENIIIFIHGGPNGNKDGPGTSNLYEILQNLLLEVNIESVRFDFMGEGDSSGDYINTSLNSQIEDFQAIINEAKTLGYKNISIIAESFGVSCLLGIDPNQFSNLVLLWGAVYFFDQDLCFAPWYNKENKKEIEKYGFFMEGSKKIGPELINSIRDINNLEESFSRIRVPTLIIHGSEDTEVPLSEQTIRLYSKMNRNSKVILLPGLDHFLQIPNSGGEVDHSVLYYDIIEWLKIKIYEQN